MTTRLLAALLCVLCAASPALSLSVQSAEGGEESPYIIVLNGLVIEPFDKPLSGTELSLGADHYDQRRKELRRARFLNTGVSAFRAQFVETQLKDAGASNTRQFLRGLAISAWMTPELAESVRTWPEVNSVQDDKLLGAQLSVSTSALLAPKFWGAGITGGSTSSFEAGILDSGIDVGHPSFSAKSVVYSVIFGQASGDPGFADSYAPDDLANHGTPVAGILLGAGSPGYEANRGVAFGQKNVVNLKSAFLRSNGAVGLYYSDAIDNIDWGIFGAADDLDSLNFSYGTPTSSDDSSLARFMDATVDALGIPIVISAGNYGPTGTTLVDPGIAYNAITVGSIYDFGTNSRTDDSISFSSSRGPTPGGRKKPDLVAPGGFISSPNKQWETQADYVNFSGTSFAAPHITGAVHLLMDALGPPVDPRVIKALLINGAEDWGSYEWNANYGWGYTNLERTLSMLNSVWLHTVAEKGKAGDFKLYRGKMQSMDNVTVVWNRHVNYAGGGFYPGTWYALNDINMFLYDESNGELLDSATSGIDNVEQVSVTAGTYETVVKVRANDTVFQAVANETYSLVGPAGYEFPSDLPKPIVEVFLPEPIPQGVDFPVVAVVQNSGDFNCFGAQVSLGNFVGTSRVMGADTQAAGALASNKQAAQLVSWVLNSGALTSSVQLTVDVSAAGYGETWSGSAGEQLTISSGPVDLVELVNITVLHLGGDQYQVQAQLHNSAAQAVSSASLRFFHDSSTSLISGGALDYFGSIGAGLDSNVATWIVSAPDSPDVAIVGEGFFAGTRSRAVFSSSAPGLSSGATRFGAATLGCAGAPVIGTNLPAQLGNPGFAVTCLNASPFSSGVLAWSPMPAAIPAAILGADVWLDMSSVQVVAATCDQFGISKASFPIPSNPSLLGASLHFQYAWLDSCAPQGLSASSGVAITVQP